ncbi:MAG TPA: hypothetical protein VHV55_15950 [Pirellulales bacterium]|nr:hypothetical protein [Pirellulales bacterium]
MAGRAHRNPFYVLLVIVGIAFAITACAYGVMTFSELRGSVPAAGRGALVAFMKRHGTMLLAGELLVLAVATTGAIATDRFWQRRAKSSRDDSSADRPGHGNPLT